MNSELPHYYHYSQRRPCATPSTWLSELSLRCHQHDDEHCHLEAASHLDDAGLHASVACGAALQRRRRKSSGQLQWHFAALLRTSGGLSKRGSHRPPNMARREQTRRKHHGSPLALQPEPEFFVSRYSFLQPLAEGTQSPYQLHSL